MADFLKGLAAGFLTQATADVDARQEQARDFFSKSMEKAMTYSTSGGKALKESAQAARGAIAKLEGAGVPKHVTRSIANRDPKQLEEYYTQVAELQASGAKLSPEVFEGIFQVSKEQNEDPVELTKRIKEPLANNLKADPEAFKADPKGSIWATMLGFNAMENAAAKLETTMIGDRSAADWLRDGGQGESIEYDVGPDLDYNKVGEIARTAEKANKVDIWTPTEIMSIRTNYDKIVKENYDRILSSAGENAPRLMEDPRTMQAAQAEARAALIKMTNDPAAVEQALGDLGSSAPVEGAGGTVEPQVGAEGSLPSPKTQEDYDALPSGTQYVHPDGSTRTKP